MIIEVLQYSMSKIVLYYNEQILKVLVMNDCFSTISLPGYIEDILKCFYSGLKYVRTKYKYS